MNSWRNCYFQKPCYISKFVKGLNLRSDFCQDEAALDTSYTPSVMQESHLDEKDQPSGTCIFGTENRKLENNYLIDEMLLLKESGCSFHNQDYVEKMEEFQFYVDMVKRFTRPGCSAEALDVALSSMSSLVNTLSAIMSSKHHIIHASL